jgi:short-subunit dehydrogenase
VVVTGASAGVGRASAISFAKRGDHVVLLARGEEGLAGAAREVRDAGGTPYTYSVDVADAEAVFECVDRIEEDVGAIDVWVNDAFSSVFAPFWEITAEEFRRTTEVTYLGFVYATMAVLRHMRARDRGAIVQVGSALAYRGIPLQSAYCGSKHAIQGFNESLRCELLHEKSGVSVTMVQLPALNTPQFSWVRSKLPRHAQPVPPIYQPEVAARAIVHAADHPKRREYWVGSTTAATIAANAVAPGLLDRYLARTGFQGQQTSQAPPPDAKQGNLDKPEDADRDYRTRGEFDDQAHTIDPQTWASRHHGVLAGAGAAAGAALAAAWRRSR